MSKVACIIAEEALLFIAEPMSRASQDHHLEEVFSKINKVTFVGDQLFFNC